MGVFIDSDLSMENHSQANCLVLLQHVTTGVQYLATGTDRCLLVTSRRVGSQLA